MGEELMKILSVVFQGAVANLGMLRILSYKNNRGEVGDLTPPVEPKPEANITQEHLNNVVSNVKRELMKKYEAEPNRIKDLEEQLSGYKRKEEALTQSKLEEQKEYEKLKESFQTKENEYKNLISQREVEVNDMKIGTALTSAIIENNAHADTAQLIKSQAFLNDKGEVVIKIKDANGFENELSVKEGVAQFLKDRPYLVKAGGGSGSGTPPSGAGVPIVGNTDPFADGRELQEAMRIGDRKKVVEIKARIASKKAQQPNQFIN